MKTPERRRFVRTAVSWHVRLWCDRGMIPAMADDVSDHGIRIITARKADVTMGRSYRVDVFAGSASEQSLVVEARHADDRGRIGFLTRSRWQPPIPRPEADAT